MTREDSWYEIVEGPDLEQGDFIEHCPVYVPEYDDSVIEGPGQRHQIKIKERIYNIVIMSQSCDLGHGKVQSIVVCPCWTLEQLASINDHVRSKKVQEKIRQGLMPNFHMAHECTLEEMIRETRVVDFRTTFIVPYDFLTQFANAQGKRLRLISPYKESMSQAFGHFFSRVAIPKNIPAFK